jgi:hypothetical protein
MLSMVQTLLDTARSDLKEQRERHERETTALQRELQELSSHDTAFCFFYFFLIVCLFKHDSKLSAYPPPGLQNEYKQTPANHSVRSELAAERARVAELRASNAAVLEAIGDEVDVLRVVALLGGDAVVDTARDILEEAENVKNQSRALA